MPLHEAKLQFEQQNLIKLLRVTQGNVSQAARMANLNRKDFHKLLNRHHIVPSLLKSPYDFNKLE